MSASEQHPIIPKIRAVAQRHDDALCNEKGRPCERPSMSRGNRGVRHDQSDSRAAFAAART